MRAHAPSVLLCGVLAVGVLTVGALASGSVHAARPDAPASDELFRFSAEDVVETHATEHFVVHFTRAGENAVPLTDADGTTVPDHVEELGAVYEEVFAHYTGALGFRAPLDDSSTDPSGDPRFDVYLVDFGFSADGAFRPEACRGDVCAGFMVQENDFAGYGYPSARYANRVLASHEFFHAVQAAYSASQGPTFGEGTAVWASEQFDPSLDDLEWFAEAYLEQTDRPLNAPVGGPVDSFTYGSALFWQFLGEELGADVIRALWQACSDNPGVGWFELLDEVIVDAGGEGLATLFTRFAHATLMTGDRADPSRSFVHGAELPELVPESETLPVRKDRFLVFVSSYRTLSVNPGPRDTVRAVLVGTGVDMDGLVLTLAPYGRSEVGALTPGVPTERGLEAVVAAPDEGFVFVQVVQTRTAGNGARPALCIGDDDEVDACLAELAAAAAEDEDENEDEDGSGSTDADPTGRRDDDGATSAADSCAASGGHAGWLCLVAPLHARRALRRRRGPDDER